MSGKPVSLIYQKDDPTLTSSSWSISRAASRDGKAGSITLNDGTSMPALAFGTGTALYGKSAEEQVIQALEVH